MRSSERVYSRGGRGPRRDPCWTLMVSRCGLDENLTGGRRTRRDLVKPGQESIKGKRGMGSIKGCREVRKEED